MSGQPKYALVNRNISVHSGDTTAIINATKPPVYVNVPHIPEWGQADIKHVMAIMRKSILCK